MTWICPLLFGGQKQKHVSAFIVAFETGCMAPGLETTNQRTISSIPEIERKGMTSSKKTFNRAPTDIRVIRREVLEAVAVSHKKLAFKDLEKILATRFEINLKVLKTAIRSLVADRKLVYTYHFGCSFLELSVNRPTRISKRTILKPAGGFYQPEPDEVVVELQHGASFGTGEHPTTRLAIRAIEKAFSKKELFPDRKNILGLDIGTGSGILAIVAALFGAAKVLGIDIDPCARAEAKQNVNLNNLANQIQILDIPLENIHKQYSLIIANLRYPTLKRLCSHIAGITENRGIAVISGIKTSETADLLNCFSQAKFNCFWQEFEKDWAGMAFVRS